MASKVIAPGAVVGKAGSSKPVGPGKGNDGGGSSLPRKRRGLNINIPFFRRVKLSELSMATRELATFVRAGISVVEGLEGVAEGIRPGLLRDQILQVIQEIREGTSLSGALGHHPKTFDKLYLSMVEVGETSGALDTILGRLADFMEKRETMRRKIRGAMTYPAVVMSVAFALVAVVMTYVVPSFESMFKDLGNNLPMLTQVLLDLSRACAKYWYLIPIVPVALIWGYRLGTKGPRARYFVDLTKLKMPVFGKLITKSVIAQFTRTLSTLIGSGVDVLVSLRIIEGTITNSVIVKAVREVRDNIKEGSNMAETVAATGAFPPIVRRFIAAGERTGKLEEMLARVADKFQSEVDTAVDSFKSIVEPVLLVVLGIVIGGIVIALFLPLIEITKSIR